MLDAMTGPLRRFDPFRPIDMLTSLWSSAAVGPVSSGAAMAYRTLFTTVRRLVVGRRLAIRLDDGMLTLTVTEFDSRLDVRGLAVGQLNDVRIVVRDIHWEDQRFTHATAVLHNVHMRPTAPPVMVAAPVDLTLEVPTAALRRSVPMGGATVVRRGRQRRGRAAADGPAPDARPHRDRRAARRHDAVAPTPRPRCSPITLDTARQDPGLSRAPSRTAPRPTPHRYRLRPRCGVPVSVDCGMADGFAA